MRGLKALAIVALTLALAPLTNAEAAARKYHPGHYIAFLRGIDSQSVMLSSQKPGVRGYMKRYTWRELEPSEGNYNFSEIQSDLNWARAYGMQLIVMIEDKTFVPERPTPGYIPTVPNIRTGYTAVRWSPYVVARQKALVRALGARFDADPAFEGIAFQETSDSLNDATRRAWGYTPEKYRDAYIDLLRSAGQSLPTSRVFWFMNFLAGKQAYLGDIANAVAAYGVVMGGPDVLPDNQALVKLTYPLYDQFQSRMPLFNQVEGQVYAAPHMTSGYSTKYWTMSELFRYARDRLHVDYMFWVRIPKSNPPDSYNWNDALPVIANNPTFNQ